MLYIKLTGPGLNNSYWWLYIQPTVPGHTSAATHVYMFKTKPTARQIRKAKRVAHFTSRLILKETQSPYGLPEGYEMACKDGWGNDYYQTFISIGWTVEQLIEHGYLRRIGAA